MHELKEKMLATWMAGDFGKIAEHSAKDAEVFVASVGITPAMQVLDVACGTGNVAIPAARVGAQVTGVDIAANLLRQARARASSEGLDIAFEEGDAEDLPFMDAQFDMVVSMFGAMFAPDPDRVATELARVCRHGGKIAKEKWTPGGFAGKMFRLSNRYAPPPVELPAPTLWGDEAVARLRLDACGVQVEMSRRTIFSDFPFPPREVVAFFREYFGPVKMTFARLDPARQKEYRDDLERLWSENNEGDDQKTSVRNEYLEVIGTRI